ncbi:M48 family metallopeptidase [Microbulbifer sp. OS29]|uniref:M48 family metallopeptidase n=1 Tax=Microbulbifer okhotskensis TaxID=2926617 RepID=A0A9X2EMU4_9GAMM|nr:SprT family zinc-dependent metalloprotease [Microbulbifer okhotskensis]MCO1334631.1 M48 family metallopeptidase [Microbulbifer okhotskensis]
MIPGPEFVFEDIAYRLVRSSRRKRLGLVLVGEGVEVRIPQRCAARYGHEFLQENIQWVRAQLLVADRRAAQVPKYQYAVGEYFPWLGLKLPLQRVANSQSAGISDDTIRLYSRYREPDEVQLQSALERLYQREALTLLTKKSQLLAEQMGLRIASVGVRRTKSKWGHCSIRAELQFNWLICLAPEPVVDYLVTHEVCHLQHHNHSRAFWLLVQRVCPQFKELRRWLRDNGHRLTL